jgi:membrane-associated phospholipid phosphatase
VDWQVAHALNAFAYRQHWIGSAFHQIESYGVVLFGVAAFALWLLDRPGDRRHWKVASAFGLASGALGLLVNQVIGRMWHRDRPWETHGLYPNGSVHQFGPPSHDPSFPSDHASAAFGIAFGVFLVDRVAGLIFIAAAVVLSFGRLLVGSHYPTDVVAGALVGLACAVLVGRFGRPAIAFLRRLVERVTVPIVAPVRRRRAVD